jgi:hypothetical protein
VSVNPATTLRAAHTVAVAPTETLLDSFTREELRTAKRITYQVYNPTAQTFAGIIYLKVAGVSVFAPSTMPDFANVAPGDSALAHIDVEGVDALEIRGLLDGLGGDIEAGATRKAATP